MPTNSYDVIVIGNHFAGIVAASLCASRGLRVLLLGEPGQAATYRLGDLTLPIRHRPFVGISSPSVRRVLDELNLEQVVRQKLRHHEPAFQLVCPSARIDVDQDDRRLAEALDREFGKRFDGLLQNERLFATAMNELLGHDSVVPPTSFWERREISKFVSPVEDDAAAWLEAAQAAQRLSALFALPALFDTHSASISLTPQMIARSFHTWRMGTPRIPWQTLEEILTTKLLAHGGESRRARIGEILVRWGRASGLRLRSGEELGAEYVIAAMPIASLAQLVDEKRQKKLQIHIDTISDCDYRYTLNLVVADAGIPEAMGTTVLVLSDPNEPATPGNSFAIHRGPSDAEARTVLTLEALCPAPEPATPDALARSFAQLRHQLAEQLEEVMPFVSEHILLSHSPYESVAPEGIIEGKPPPPAIPQRTYRLKAEPFAGIAGVPHDVGIKHVAMAADQVLPGLGLEGSFRSGFGAAKLACDTVGSKKKR